MLPLLTRHRDKLIWTAIALTAALASFLLMAPAAQAQDAGKEIRQAKPFSGITTAQASSALPNIGQTMHLITVIFPAEVAQVTGVQVRLEASYDNTTYIPISEDVTTVPLVGGVVYKIVVAYGAWPYVRVRSATDTGGPLMTVYYAGTVKPVVSVIQQSSDRFIL